MRGKTSVCVFVTLFAGLYAVGLARQLLNISESMPSSCQQLRPLGDSQRDLIVVLQEDADIERLRLICTADAATANVSGISADCHMPSCCRRVYTHVLKGVAGTFSGAQLDSMSACMPGALHYCEPDATVHKLEVVEEGRWQRAAQRASKQQARSLRRQHGSRPGRRLTATPAAEETQREDPLFHVEQAAGPAGPAIEVLAPQSDPLPLPIMLPPLTAAMSGQRFAPTGLKLQQLGLASWNLDRINQRLLPLDQQYSFGSAESAGTGRGATIYALDSGVRLTHKEFLDWPNLHPRVSYGYDFIDDGADAPDCDGHGSIVASVAMGRVVGVAKEAGLVALRVLDCNGAGTVSNVVAALDWVVHNATRPAVATLSLGIPVGTWSRTLEAGVQRVLASGVLVVVAAGNNDVDACTVAPANVPGALTVSASDLSTKWGVTSATDKEIVYRFANTGRCMDLFAPGVDIYAACGSANRCDNMLNDTAYTFASGTSMAVPHAAGLAAIYLADHPEADPAEVHAAIVNAATPGRLDPASLRPGTPNRLIYTGLPQPQVSAAQGPPETSGGYGG